MRHLAINGMYRSDGLKNSKCVTHLIHVYHAVDSLLNRNSSTCSYRKKIIIDVNINMICSKHCMKEIYILSTQKYSFSEN